jgi:8-oxo-dGTP diphosphatase
VSGGRRAIHVVIGLIADARGRWLIGCRRPGTDLAGFWEFPGGKSADGEAPLAALRRELDEELGIELRAAEPFIELVHDYPDKRVRLDVWRVLEFTGEPSPREGQRLRWVTLEELAAVRLLPADGPIVAALRAAS